MSKVKIEGHASGSGTLTIQAPDTNSSRTITLPDATGNLLASEGAVTINESGADVDFRVESDTNTHALFVQGSDGAVGIGVTPPTDIIVGYTSLSLGGNTTVHTNTATSTGASLYINQNAYRDTDPNWRRITDSALATQYWQTAGTHRFNYVASGSGDITWSEAMRIDASGNVGIGTTAPGQLLDVNSGGGNAIADGWDTHSLAIYKENIEDASGYLDKVLACPAQKWNRKPFVSADEIKEAVLEEFGEDVLIEEAVEAQDAVYEDVEVTPATEAVDAVIEQRLVSEAIEAKDAVYEKQYSVWDELFPEENSHRQKALYNMPDGDLKTWIDDWCEAKRVEMRPEDKWQKKRLGLVADAELTAEHLPEVVSINDEGEPTGIDMMTYIGILHNAIQELSTKVEALENTQE